MKGMDRKRNRLILLMLILPLAAVLVSTGCNKKNDGLYQFVVTSATKSETSEESGEVPSESMFETESETSAETQTEETESETTESEISESETTTKAEAKQETKKATTKATNKATTKKTVKATAKKATKATTKKKKATPTPTKKPTTKPKISGYLFVGDSRTVGLYEAVDGVSKIAKVGAKVTYLQSVLGEVTKTRGKNVIFNFGVNDLGNINKYISVYKSLPKEFIQNNNVIFMSVNPTDGDKYGSWNTDIDKFNKKLKANLPSGVKYLDTNSTLKKEGFSTRDGVHYKAVTYKRIAQLVFNFCGDKNRKA